MGSSVTRALYRGSHKFVWSSDGRHALYYLASDPGEQEDLTARHPELAHQMEAALEDFVERLGEPAAATASEPLDPEVREMLEALGYAPD